jgi:integral membrane sensor domain MASE1
VDEGRNLGSRWRRACAGLVWVYVVGCGLALAVVPATGAGILPPNPFAALGAVVLALPWSVLSQLLFADLGVAANLALVAAGMAVNALLLRRLCRRRR